MSSEPVKTQQSVSLQEHVQVSFLLIPPIPLSNPSPSLPPNFPPLPPDIEIARTVTDDSTGWFSVSYGTCLSSGISGTFSAILSRIAGRWLGSISLGFLVISLVFLLR